MPFQLHYQKVLYNKLTDSLLTLIEFFISVISGLSVAAESKFLGIETALKPIGTVELLTV